MKTTDAMVLDEPKTHVPGADAVIEPAVESRPRPATGVKEAKIYIDGKFYSEASAKISVLDHGLLYGDGIFEGIRFYNGRVFRLEEHLRPAVGFSALDLSGNSNVDARHDGGGPRDDPAKSPA